MDWILNDFTKNTKVFSENHDTLGFEIIPYYKKNILSSIEGNVYFNNLIISFEYTVHGMLSVTNSILECKFIFDKSNWVLRYSFYDLLNIIDLNCFESFTLPNIYNENRMSECFNWLAQNIDHYMPKILELSNDDEQKKLLKENLLNDTMSESVTFENETFEWTLKFYHAALRERCCDLLFTALVKGTYKKAIKQYSKAKRLSLFELRLLKYMREHVKEIPKSRLPKSILVQIADGKKDMFGINGVLLIIGLALVLAMLYGLLYGVLFYGILIFLQMDALYVIKPEIYELFLPAFLTGIVSIYYMRKHIYKLLYRKTYQKILQLDEIKNGKKQIA